MFYFHRRVIQIISMGPKERSTFIFSLNKKVIDYVNISRKHYLLFKTLNIFSSKQELT